MNVYTSLYFSTGNGSALTVILGGLWLSQVLSPGITLSQAALAWQLALSEASSWNLWGVEVESSIFFLILWGSKCGWGKGWESS